MTRSKRNALRLALYLDSIGIEPMLCGKSYKEHWDVLTEQFSSLTQERRKEARQLGRMRIRKAPGLRKAAEHLVPPPPPTPAKRGKRNHNQEIYWRKMLLWPPETPPCRTCRMWAGLPKRSWPSQQQAEEVRLRQNDPLLAVFECPAQKGFWHLGHKRGNAKEQRPAALPENQGADINRQTCLQPD